jgi:hypothetical protein
MTSLHRRSGNAHVMAIRPWEVILTFIDSSLLKFLDRNFCEIRMSFNLSARGCMWAILLFTGYKAASSLEVFQAPFPP